MAWTVRLRESVIEDFRWFGCKEARRLLGKTEDRLTEDPTAETRNLKTLRPNPVAQRELRLLGKYRVLFDADPEVEVMTIILVGEKRGNQLLVQGEEFPAHHESDPSE